MQMTWFVFPYYSSHTICPPLPIPTLNHDTTQSLETNYVFYSVLNCYVVYLLQASPNRSACFIQAPHSWGFVVKHNDAPQSVGFPWTRVQFVTETSTWQYTHKTRNRQTSITPVGFEPTIPAGERALNTVGKSNPLWIVIRSAMLRF